MFLAHERGLHFSVMSIDSIHKNIKYLCDQCPFKASSKLSIVTQLKSIPCQQCTNKANQKSNFILHLRTVYEGVKYTGKKCGFTAKSIQSYNYHTNSKHEDVKHSCDLDQCEYKISSKSNLY